SLREDAASILPALERRLTLETVPDVRVRVILCLAALQADAAARAARYSEAFLNEPARRTRLLLALASLVDLGNGAAQAAVESLVAAMPHVQKAHLSREAELKRAHAGSGSLLQRIDGASDDDEDKAAEPSPHVLEFARELVIVNGLASLYPNLYHVSEALQNVEHRRLQSAISPLIAALRAYGAAPEPIFSIWSSLAQALV